MNRTGHSVFQRHKRIKNLCLEFEGHFPKVLAANPTGEPTDLDIFKAALASYNGRLELDGGSHKAI